MFVRVLISLFAFSSIPLFSAMAANEFPTSGILYNTKENSSMTYDCTKIEGGRLQCDFVQSSVRKKTNLEEVKKKIEEAKKYYADAIKEMTSKKDCEMLTAILSVYDGKTDPEKFLKSPLAADIDKEKFLKNFKEGPSDQREDIMQSFRAFSDFCNLKTEESFLKITELEQNKALKTCSVGTNAFKQTFKKISNTGSDIWVVDSSPEGPCGIVQLSRFEAEQRGNNIVFWRYIAKKAITNPNGDPLFPGLKCKDFDEAEYTYDWKDEKYRKLYCDYIEFSPF